jgi:hypothetical protein
MRRSKSDPVFGVKALERLKTSCDDHEKRKPLIRRGITKRKYGASRDVKDYLKYIYDPEQ